MKWLSFKSIIESKTKYQWGTGMLSFKTSKDSLKSVFKSWTRLVKKHFCLTKTFPPELLTSCLELKHPWIIMKEEMIKVKEQFINLRKEKLGMKIDIEIIKDIDNNISIINDKLKHEKIGKENEKKKENKSMINKMKNREEKLRKINEYFRFKNRETDYCKLNTKERENIKKEILLELKKDDLDESKSFKFYNGNWKS